MPFCTVDRDFDNHDLPLQQGHLRVTTRLPQSTSLKDQGLTRGLAGSRLLILLTHRAGEPRDVGGGADALLIALHRTGSVTDLMLDGLAGRDVVELAADLLGDEPPAALS